MGMYIIKWTNHELNVTVPYAVILENLPNNATSSLDRETQGHDLVIDGLCELSVFHGKFVEPKGKDFMVAITDVSLDGCGSAIALDEFLVPVLKSSKGTFTATMVFDSGDRQTITAVDGVVSYSDPDSEATE